MDLTDYSIDLLCDDRYKMQLAELYMAYNNPYPEPMTWRDYKQMGITPLTDSHCSMDEIVDTMADIQEFHIDENGDIKPGVITLSNWQQRLINSWSRK